MANMSVLCFLSTVFASWLAYFTLFTALAGPVVHELLDVLLTSLICTGPVWSLKSPTDSVVSTTSLVAVTA